MFKIDKNTQQINITRGDIGTIELSAQNEDKTDYVFHSGDVIRFGIFKKKDYETLILQKDVTLTEDATMVEIELDSEDTTIGDIKSKPVVYWYEIQLNPDTEPQTIIGYDKSGAKEFVLYPEGVKDDNE